MKYFETNKNAIVLDQGKDKNRGNNIDTLNIGRTVLRVLPPWSEEGVWFRPISEYYFRLGDGHLFITSPLDFGMSDPFDEYARSVYQVGDEEAVEEARKFRAKNRFLLNVVIVSDNKGTTPADGIKILKVPKAVKKQLVDFDIDPEYGDITNLEKGFNMIIERSGEGLETQYHVKAQRERTNIFEITKQHGLELNDLSLHDLEEVHRSGLREEAEMKSLLEQLRSTTKDQEVRVKGQVEVPS